MFGSHIFGTDQIFGNNLIFGTFVPYLYMQDVPKLNIPRRNVEIFGSEYLFRTYNISQIRLCSSDRFIFGCNYLGLNKTA